MHVPAEVKDYKQPHFQNHDYRPKICSKWTHYSCINTLANFNSLVKFIQKLLSQLTFLSRSNQFQKSLWMYVKLWLNDDSDEQPLLYCSYLPSLLTPDHKISLPTCVNDLSITCGISLSWSITLQHIFAVLRTTPGIMQPLIALMKPPLLSTSLMFNHETSIKHTQVEVY